MIFIAGLFLSAEACSLDALQKAETAQQIARQQEIAQTLRSMGSVEKTLAAAS